jgi:hypothetical protein
MTGDTAGTFLIAMPLGVVSRLSYDALLVLNGIIQ